MDTQMEAGKGPICSRVIGGQDDGRDHPGSLLMTKRGSSIVHLVCAPASAHQNRTSFPRQVPHSACVCGCTWPTRRAFPKQARTTPPRHRTRSAGLVSPQNAQTGRADGHLRRPRQLAGLAQALNLRLLTPISQPRSRSVPAFTPSVFSSCCSTRFVRSQSMLPIDSEALTAFDWSGCSHLVTPRLRPDAGVRSRGW